MAGIFNGRVMIVDGDEKLGIHYQNILERSGFRVSLVANLSEMETSIKTVSYDHILLDTKVRGIGGMDALSFVLKCAPFAKVYVMASSHSIHGAVEAMRGGATGYYEKSSDLSLLIPDLSALPLLHRPASAGGAELGLIGDSSAMQEVREAIERLKEVDSMVLLLGESGTGKEVVARAIHKSSTRSQQRFDAINCGAIPEALLESELFGHKRGAFTDAKTDRKGIFELCSNGTLLLDEIGDMPLMLQMKLLRVLQEWEVTPVGSSVPIKIKTRVISATHHDLKAEARTKQFREDLYYRLSIVVINLPPLRERLEDIPVLARYFLEGLQKRFNREIRPLSPSVLNRLLKHNWPGNVRELQNALERAVVMAKNGEIDLKDVFAHLIPTAKEAISSTPERLSFDPALYSWPLTEAKLEFERNYLRFHLTSSRGQIPEVADRSGRYKADVYRLLSRHGIDQACFRS